MLEGRSFKGGVNEGWMFGGKGGGGGGMIERSEQTSHCYTEK